MALLQRKLYFSKDPEGVQHFLARGGGSNFFQGWGEGVQILISIETHNNITCDFPGVGGVQTPPPLWIRTWYSWFKVFASMIQIVWSVFKNMQQT